jgi:tetratricopeptide (TPR) repeat protein
VKSFLGQFLFFCFGSLLLTSTAFAVSCHPESARSTTAADTARASLDFATAEKLYAAELKSSPDSEDALIGYSISLLDEDKVAEALAAAQNAIQQKPKSADLMAVLGEIQFRLANLKEAGAAFQSALALDPCSARAHYAIVRFLEANSMHASAQQQLDVAHLLAPSDPTITAQWRRWRPAAERATYLKQELSQSNISEMNRKNLTDYISYLEKQSEIEKEGGCRVVSNVKNLTQTMVPLGGGDTRASDMGSDDRALGLDVRLNDKASARLLFDTGASGIFVSRVVAERAGLKPFRKLTFRGFGDEAEPTGYSALVDDLRIGQLEFKNCMVQVSDKNGVVDHEGLIGGDVFESFLITVDFPMKKIRFSQLPTRPGEAVSEATLKTSGRGGSEELHDRYIAPEMKDWVRVLKINDDLIIPTTIRDNHTHMFIIDTGAYSCIIDTGVASGVTKVSKTDTIVEGVSGKVKEVRRGDSVFVQFGNLKARLDDATLVDTSRFSKADRLEIGGFVGFSALRFTTMQIDYRDGLVHFSYDRRQGFDQY